MSTQIHSSPPESPPPTLSIAVPVFDEEAVLEAFFARLLPVVRATGESFEIVCVNDGSRDRTLEVLRGFQSSIPELVLVDLSRNFGKDAALTAAIDHCRGQAVIPIDADLQDPPELIPDLLAKWREGFEVVTARRLERTGEGLLKRLTAGAFYRLFNRIAQHPIPVDTGDFRLLDRAAVRHLRELRERNRFMKGLFSWVGFSQTEVTYTREARGAGQTKWNYWKLWNFALDGLFSFSTFPLRIWLYLGLGVACAAFLYTGFIIANVLVAGREVPGYASIIVSILFLSGIQLIGLGIMGEYLARVYDEVKARPLYIVRERSSGGVWQDSSTAVDPAADDPAETPPRKDRGSPSPEPAED